MKKLFLLFSLVFISQFSMAACIQNNTHQGTMAATIEADIGCGTLFCDAAFTIEPGQKQCSDDIKGHYSISDTNDVFYLNKDTAAPCNNGDIQPSQTIKVGSTSNNSSDSYKAQLTCTPVNNNVPDPELETDLEPDNS